MQTATARPIEWEPSPDHEPRADQPSLFDAGEPVPAPAKPGRRRESTGPTLFDLIPVEDA